MEMRQIVCLAGLVALLSCPAWADIINGSFETGDFTGWLTDESRGFAEVGPGGTDGSWMARLTLEGYYLPPPRDTQFGDALVGVFQHLEVPLHARFLLFDAWVDGFGVGYAHLPCADPTEMIITVTQPTTFAIPVSQVSGQDCTFYFVGRDTDVGSNHAYLDNVRFTDVPEPTTAMLVLSSMALICGFGQRHLHR